MTSMDPEDISKMATIKRKLENSPRIEANKTAVINKHTADRIKRELSNIRYEASLLRIGILNR